MSQIGMNLQSDENRRMFEDEAIRIVDLASAQGLTLRVLGSLAFHIHCQKYDHLQKQLGRAYTDIDYAGYSDEASKIGTFLVSLGYQEDLNVNILFGGERLIYNHPTTEMHIDIFFDRLNFCHEINWVGRLGVDQHTIPLAEMLLEKMQIVKINEKDIIDTLMLLLEHPLGDIDNETINIARISKLCAKDWGLWRTITMNLYKVSELGRGYPQLSASEKITLDKQVVEAIAKINEESKSLAWKLRAKIGERVRWYQEVDEIE